MIVLIIIKTLYAALTIEKSSPVTAKQALHDITSIPRLSQG